MGNNIYVDHESIARQKKNLTEMISDKLAVDKISEISTLLTNDLGETAAVLGTICDELTEIEKMMTSLVSSTSAMLSYVDSAYENTDTVDTNAV